MRAAKEAVEKKVGELGPKLKQMALELGVARKELDKLREAEREGEEQMVPLAIENGTLRKEVEFLRESEARVRAEYAELQQASEHERLYLTKEAGTWRDLTKRNQLEMEMYVGKKVNELGDALRNTQDVPQLVLSGGELTS